MRHFPMSLLTVAVLTATLGLAGPAVVGGADARSWLAAATLKLADGTAIGTVGFSDDGGMTQVRVDLDVPEGSGALDAFHGFHIHANDDAANGEDCAADAGEPSSTWFASADGHLAVGDEVHDHHAGDMPSLLVNADGTATAAFTTGRVTVDDLQDRVVILHAGPDNAGNVPTGPSPDRYTPNSQAALDKTMATGNAGDRMACGVIRVYG